MRKKVKRDDPLAKMRPGNCAHCAEPIGDEVGAGLVTRHDMTVPIRVHHRCLDEWLRHLRRTAPLDCKAILDPPEYRRAVWRGWPEGAE